MQGSRTGRVFHYKPLPLCDAKQVRTRDHQNMSSAPRTRNLTVRIFRKGEAPPPQADWEGTTAEERINAVWELTRLCLAWSGSDEPRLQRSVCRVQHPSR